MKKNTKKIQSKIEDILKDIQKDVLEKHGIKDVHIIDITFSKNAAPPGLTRRCKYYGTNPITGEPIIKCTYEAQ